MSGSLNAQHYCEELALLLRSPVLRVFFWRLIPNALWERMVIRTKAKS